MKRVSVLFLLLTFILTLSFCGKKGPILPPLQRIPKAVEDIQVVQRGEKIIVTWRNPVAYTDGSLLEEIKEIEIWCFMDEKKEESTESVGIPSDFEKQAKLVKKILKEDFRDYRKEESQDPQELQYIHTLSIPHSLTKRLIFAVRVKDHKGKEAQFSQLSPVEPKALPFPPSNLEANVFEDHVEVCWEAPQRNIDESTPASVKGYNIFRADEGKPFEKLNSTLIAETHFRDANFQFGRHYEYFIRASGTDSLPFLESEDSEIKEILTKDTFPPLAPEGLVAISGDKFVTLSWDESKDKNLGGYRIWRKREGEDEFSLLLPQLLEETTFYDDSVEVESRYEYAVTAVDLSGNESQKSEAVTVTVKDVPYEDLPL